MGESKGAVLPALAFVIAMCAAASPACAHKLNVFAVVEGRTIRGEAYFRGGGPARGAVVTALGPAGQRLGNATTDDQGRFTIQAQVRSDHRLVVDAGGGHVGQYRIAADELPKELPAADAPSPSGVAEPEATADRPLADDPTPIASQGSVPSDASPSLEALRVQVVKLREDLDGFRNEIRLRDVIGGIGYIVGAMGLVLYVVARRRHRDG